MNSTKHDAKFFEGSVTLSALILNSQHPVKKAKFGTWEVMG